MSKPDLNPLGQALAFASQDKYKGNELVESILNNFNYQKQIYEMQNLIDPSIMLKAYEEGLKGRRGYSYISIGNDTVETIMKSVTVKMLRLNAAQQAGECLIRVMQSLGEDIEGY